MNLIPYPVVKGHKTTAAIAKGHYPPPPPPTNHFKYLAYFLIHFICHQFQVTQMEQPSTKLLGFKNTAIPNYHCTHEWGGGVLHGLQYYILLPKRLRYFSIRSSIFKNMEKHFKIHIRHAH
jgi:hypothetical protein